MLGKKRGTHATLVLRGPLRWYRGDRQGALAARKRRRGVRSRWCMLLVVVMVVVMVAVGLLLVELVMEMIPPPWDDGRVNRRDRVVGLLGARGLTVCGGQ